MCELEAKKNMRNVLGSWTGPKGYCATIGTYFLKSDCQLSTTGTYVKERKIEYVPADTKRPPKKETIPMRLETE